MRGGKEREVGAVSYLRRLRSLGGRLRAVIRRLRIWIEVATYISGVQSRDRAAMRRSLAGAPRDVFRSLDKWRDPTVAVDCRVVAKGVGTFDVRARSDDLYHVLPTRERAVINAIRRHLQPGDCFVDAGANIGVYSVLASNLVGQAGRVVAIEMVPETAGILRRHLELNACCNATVLEAALSRCAGQTVTAHIPQRQFGQASIVTGKGERMVEVKTTTLALALAGVDRVKLLKMDLEGAELEALQGAEPVLARIDAILFETWVHSDIPAFLIELGFRVSRLDRRNFLAMRRPAS